MTAFRARSLANSFGCN